jgi:hypothetical protein
MSPRNTLRVITGDDLPVGVLSRRSAFKFSGAASGCRSLGQRARWAPAVKDTDEPIQR